MFHLLRSLWKKCVLKLIGQDVQRILDWEGVRERGAGPYLSLISDQLPVLCILIPLVIFAHFRQELSALEVFI